MVANLNIFKTHEKIALYPIFLLNFIGLYIESDEKITILTLWALSRYVFKFV